jgi:hypothetical protein
MDKKQEQETKTDLEAKLKEVGETSAANIVKTAKDVLPTKEVQIVDFVVLQNEVKQQATSTVSNIANFYFNFDDIDSKAKQMVLTRMELDIISLNSVVYQIKTAEYATAQLLNEINTGITNNSIRLFEALNGLQKTNMEASKTLAQMITIFEEQYSKLKKSIDEEIMSQKVQSGEVVDDGIERGTKSFLKEMSNLDEEIESFNNDETEDDIK